MKNSLKYLFCLMLPILLVCAGCKTSANLQTGGAYAPAGKTPDAALFIADSSYQLAYNTVDGILKFGMDNESALPAAVKVGLDKARPVVWDIDQRWSLARATYLAAPSAGNLASMQGILAEIQNLIPTLQALISAKTTATPTN